MLRRCFLLLSCISCLTLSLTTVSQAADAQKPNLIFIMADDLGYAELGCYGQTKIKTPHIDQLAADGMKFTQAYAGCMVCQPSRSVLMTGQHTGHTAVRANDLNQLLYEEDKTVAEVLKSAGYATGCFGKWGLGYAGTPGRPNQKGFDQFTGQLLQVHAHFYYPFWIWRNEEKVMLPENENNQRGTYIHDLIHEDAKAFIRKNKDQPFFAYLPYIIPHVELVVPEESERPYRGKFPKTEIKDPRPGYIGSEDGLTTFAGMVSRLDDHVGEIVTLLKQLGIRDNTLLIFTSDNGGQGGNWKDMTDFFHGNAPLKGHKGTMYEGGLRVPFIASWPGKIAPGTTSDLQIGFWDVLPTFADAAGTKVPAGVDIDGISFLPTLLGKGKQKQHPYLYWEYTKGAIRSRALRMGDWKAVQNRMNRPVELYDLSQDIGETKDLASQHPEKVKEMTRTMEQAHTAPRDFPQTLKPVGIKGYVK
ncbi:arylsulfatase [Gimesia panareensis]|uniref:arylsulfatase n=1 Tax=Gimesia panareensis TaxID=2527978 RepID=UPI00118793DE|nr:arylsulfatase [Gimesia panareensis]QDU51816.1 Arylsulfatase [Gimesia panareensis]